MLRRPLMQLSRLVRVAIPTPAPVMAAVPSRLSHSNRPELDETLDARYTEYFNRSDIDGWEVRKAMNDLCGMDLVPEPSVVAAAMKACRRINDYSLAVRFLEAVKNKCGSQVNEIYPWVIQEVRPTLTELGIDTPEELGYDKPELALMDSEDV